MGGPAVAARRPASVRLLECPARVCGHEGPAGAGRGTAGRAQQTGTRVPAGPDQSPGARQVTRVGRGRKGHHKLVRIGRGWQRKACGRGLSAWWAFNPAGVRPGAHSAWCGFGPLRPQGVVASPACRPPREGSGTPRSPSRFRPSPAAFPVRPRSGSASLCPGCPPPNLAPAEAATRSGSALCPRLVTGPRSGLAPVRTCHAPRPDLTPSRLSSGPVPPRAGAPTHCICIGLWVSLS